MEKNILFPQRLYLFMLRQFSLYKNSAGLAGGALIGVLLLPTISMTIFRPEALHNLIGFYLILMFLSGLIFTSQVFVELHDPKKSYAYILLPVSNLEKLIGSWLISGPLYIAGFSFIVFIIQCLSSLVTEHFENAIGVFSSAYFRAISAYLTFHSVFFLGAVWFRKNNFLKTAFSIIIFFLSLALFSVAVFGLFFKGFHPNPDLGDHISAGFGHWDLVHDIGKVVVCYLLPLFFLVVSYFRLKERQV
ncbi:MAG TPA: hypothetical protein VF691_17325 [Cytophagaceae bacterium]|jgi:hypothetical protein